jgi:peptide-methionine (S)-S-oxide reductase
VIRTRVGYAGGQKDRPTYRSIGDHTETVQVDYDPARVTYAQLLDVFWASHKPQSPSWGKQYRNVIFYQNEAQREMALASKAAVAQKIGATVETDVAPLYTFTLAEDYHQKYNLKLNETLRNEMQRIYPRPQDLVDSTAAARINGYAGGNGTRDQLAREIDRLGLSEAGKDALSRLAWW